MNEPKTPSHPRRPLASGILMALAAAIFVSSVAPLAGADEAAERILIPQERFKAEKPTETAAFGGEEIEGDRRFNFDSFRSRALGLWFKRRVFIKKNLPEAAAEQTQALKNLCNEVGVTRLDDIATSLVHEGQSFLDEGNFEKARRSFEEALEFGADLPDAHLGLATTYWRRGGSYGAAAEEFAAGLRSLFRNQCLTSALFGNILIIMILSVAAVAVLFAIAMLLRYRRLVHHDLAEGLAARYPNRVPREAVDFVGWALVTLPLLTWIAALWTPVYWLALTFHYQKAREKAISAALFVLLILSTPMARAAEILFGLAADPSARLMLASTSASYDPESIVNLEEKAEANPQDPAYRFLLGGLYARGRFFQEALLQYRRVVEMDPKSHRAVNNVGNIYLRAGRPEEALKHYKTALELQPRFLPAFYNTYLARKEMLQLREAEMALKQGQQVDPSGMGQLMQRARAQGTAEPVDAVISRDEIFQRILGGASGSLGIASSLVSLPSIVAGGFLAVALLFGLVLGTRHALRCARCGEAFCARCKIGSQAPDYCTPCQHMALARDGLNPAIRRERLGKLERFRIVQARLSRLTSLLVPGLGRLLDGRTLTGVVIAGVWCAGLLALFLRPHLLQVTGSGQARSPLVIPVLLAVVAGAAWILGNLRAVRRASAAPGSWQWR